jgi:hypothetical protein
MTDPNPHDMLTRIEILERRVETLERAVTSLIGFPALVKRVERLEQAATITRRIRIKEARNAVTKLHA